MRKKLLAVSVLVYSNLTQLAFAYDQFAEADKRAKLAIEVCGNGHEATIEWGKVTACDGKPINAAEKKDKPQARVATAPQAKVRQAEKRSNLECITVDKYLFCDDGEFYEKVAPVVGVQLKQMAAGVADRHSSDGKSVDQSSGSGEGKDSASAQAK